MAFLRDLFSLDLFYEMIDQGYIRIQHHPSGELSIANYTEQAQFSRVWNPVTTQCRGLIFDTATQEVKARPLSKFWNYGEPESSNFYQGAGTPVVVTDKLDGSLAILYPDPTGGYALATRGSFTSEQAIHATEVWKERYESSVKVQPNVTMLFEVLYPGNRIVVDYNGLDDLVLLGASAIDRTSAGRTLTAKEASYFFSWKGPVAEEFPYSSLAEALAAPPRLNAEGLVVHFLNSDSRLKIKQADYVALHRIVTGLSTRTVWQHMVDGKPLEELILPLPDEFHSWVHDVHDKLEYTVRMQSIEILQEFNNILQSMPNDFTRGDFAKVAVTSPYKWALFMMLDNRAPEVERELLKRAKPAAATPSGKIFSEETA